MHLYAIGVHSINFQIWITILGLADFYRTIHQEPQWSDQRTILQHSCIERWPYAITLHTWVCIYGTILLRRIDRIHTCWHDNIFVCLLHKEEEGCHIRPIGCWQCKIDITVIFCLVINSHIILCSINAINNLFWLIKIKVSIILWSHLYMIVHSIASNKLSLRSNGTIRSVLYHQLALLNGVVLPLWLHIDKGITIVEVVTTTFCAELTKHTIIYISASHFFIGHRAQRNEDGFIWCIRRQDIVAILQRIRKLYRHLNLYGVNWLWNYIPELHIVLHRIKTNIACIDHGGIASLAQHTLNISDLHTWLHGPIIQLCIIQNHFILVKCLVQTSIIDSDWSLIIFCILHQLNHIQLVRSKTSLSTFLELYLYCFGGHRHLEVHINWVPIIIVTISFDIGFPTIYTLGQSQGCTDRRSVQPSGLIGHGQCHIIHTFFSRKAFIHCKNIVFLIRCKDHHKAIISKRLIHREVMALHLNSIFRCWQWYGHQHLMQYGVLIIEVQVGFIAQRAVA